MNIRYASTRVTIQKHQPMPIYKVFQSDITQSPYTVLNETNGTKPSVWREIGVVWAKITYLKNAVMLFLSNVQRDKACDF